MANIFVSENPYQFRKFKGFCCLIERSPKGKFDFNGSVLHLKCDFIVTFDIEMEHLGERALG